MSRAETNRANSQRSTGPKTEAGKKRSSQNALRHGLNSQAVVIPGEAPEAYQRHLQAFLDEYDPQGAVEMTLVQAIADTSWRLHRVLGLENKVLTEITDISLQCKALATLSMHSQRLSREFEKTVTLIRDIQQGRNHWLRFRRGPRESRRRHPARAKAFPPIPANPPTSPHRPGDQPRRGDLLTSFQP